MKKFLWILDKIKMEMRTIFLMFANPAKII